jgi:hypothetical protein
MWLERFIVAMYEDHWELTGNFVVSSMRVFQGLSAGKMEQPPMIGLPPPFVTPASLPPLPPLEDPFDPPLLLPHAIAARAMKPNVQRKVHLPKGQGTSSGVSVV